MSNNHQSGKNGFLALLLVAGNFIVVAAISLLACVPPVSRDALIHHLAIPKLYLEHGGIFEIPKFEFSYYPMNLELLYLIPLYFGNDIIPKFIHFTFGLLTASLIYRYLAKRLNRLYALTGSFFFMSLPIIVKLSSIAYVDLGLTFFLFASLLAIFKWMESQFAYKHLIIGAIFCGLALGTKYNGLIGFFLLTLFIPFIYSRMQSDKPADLKKTGIFVSLFFIVAVIVFSPWMIRNYIWTQNPLYPLYNKVFNQLSELDYSDDEDTDAPASMNQFQIRKHIYGESDWQIALIPIRIFFQGRDDNPKYFDGRINPFLFFLPIFAFLGIKKDSGQIRAEKWSMLFFSILFLLFVYVRWVMRIRYTAPILPPLIILSMYGLFNISHYLEKYLSSFLVKALVGIILLVMLSMNSVYIIHRFRYVEPLDYLTGKVSRQDYIRKFEPAYDTYRYANTNLSPDDKILGIYLGRRGYYADVDIEYDIHLLQRLAAAADQPQSIAERLRQRKITHLLVNYEMFNYWVQKYSLHEKRILQSFFENCVKREFSRDGHVLLRLEPGGIKS